MWRGTRVMEWGSVGSGGRSGVPLVTDPFLVSEPESNPMHIVRVYIGVTITVLPVIAVMIPAVFYLSECWAKPLG